jgi:hypothetical protein
MEPALCFATHAKRGTLGHDVDELFQRGRRYAPPPVGLAIQ